MERGRVRPDAGVTTVELLVVITLLGVLGSAAVAAAGTLLRSSHATACRAEHRTLAVALQAATVGNLRGEPPGVAGPDGLDRVRTAGLLAWEPTAAYWRYAAPPPPGTSPGAGLTRTRVDVVDLDDCGP